MDKNSRSINKYLEFWSKDNNFGLRISNSNLKKIINFCEKSFPTETGGILIGSYTKSLDCAVIETITGPPKDSKSSSNWFKRGVRGLKKLLETYWKNNHFYIGEWHFHPCGEPFPSKTDQNQLKVIGKSKDYDCSAPILIIIGGKSPHNWEIRTFVFPCDLDFHELIIFNNYASIENCVKSSIEDSQS